MGKSMMLPDSSVWSVIVVLGNPWGFLGCWLLIINLITFLVFGFDKCKAKYKERHENARRVPEKTLFLLSAIGGSLGALLGMRVFHHKTLHRSFRFGIPTILMAQIVLIGGLWVYFTFLR